MTDLICSDGVFIIIFSLFDWGRRGLNNLPKVAVLLEDEICIQCEQSDSGTLVLINTEQLPLHCY